MEGIDYEKLEEICQCEPAMAQVIETADTSNVEAAVRDILRFVGEDPDREGLLGTPDRVARMFIELTEGYREDPHGMINDALFTVDYDEMVILRAIPFESHCEHHLAPIIGKAWVAYLPHQRVQERR